MSFSEIKKMISLTLGTFFGVGLIPIMPGTITTFVIALIWYYFIPDYLFYNATENIVFYDRFLIFYLLVILFAYLSVYICKINEEEFGKDGKQIVIDEVVGYLLAVMFLPKTIMVAIYAFILFRVLDIGKPLFINKLQKLPHGWGIMLDDVAAGIFANIILLGLYKLRPAFFIINF